MTMYWKILAVVIESASPPEGGGPFLMAQADEDRALDAISRLPGDMLTASDSMGGFVVDTLIWNANVASTDYDYYGGKSYISPTKLRVTVNADPSYDYIAIYNSAAQAPASTIINGGAFNNAGYWANCSIKRCLHIGIHEFGHLIENYRRFIAKDFDNFPQCASINPNSTGSIHCALDYGFLNTHPTDPDPSLSPWAQVSPAWYYAFYTASLPDGRGMTAFAWGLPTKWSTQPAGPLPPPLVSTALAPVTARVLRLRPTLQVATIDNRPLRDISDLITGGKVTMNSRAATPWTLRCELREPAGLLPFLDYLAPSLEVIYADGTVVSGQCGLYVVAPPPKRHDREGTSSAVEGRDLTWLLDIDAFADTYSIDVADDPIVALTAIIVSSGIPASSIRFGAKTTPEGRPIAAPVVPSARDWPIATSTTKLTIANDILAMIGYAPLGTDGTGRVGSDPYRDVQMAEPDVTYASGPGSAISGDLSEAGLPLGGFANVIVVYAGSPATGDAVVPADTVNPTVANGRTVRVTADIGLRLRDAGSLSAPILLVMPLGTAAVVTGTSVASGGYTWWPITAQVTGVGSRSGWAAGTWLATVAGDPNPVTQPDLLRPPIYAYRENDDPASPVSTVSLGKRFVRIEAPSGIETQAQADELADQMIAEALGYHRELTLRTLPDPRRSMREVYALNVVNKAGDVIVDGNWTCSGWELGFRAQDAVMTHTCHRVEPFAGKGAFG